MIETPGVPAARSAKLVTPRAKMSAPDKAVMLTGVLSAKVERFCAVTTTSVTPLLDLAAACCALAGVVASAADRASRLTVAHAKARLKTKALFFMNPHK